jgi:tRNA nucleotidyltransferase (CCA-adding enzyme)
MGAASSAADVENLERLEVPEAVRRIAERLEREGYPTWTVGGAVRDALLGVGRSDWDLATAARPEVVRKLFRPSYPIGIQFGTVGVRGADGMVYEVTTFRRDIETDGRHAVVEYADEIQEDLARRDFTVNAIAYHPLSEKFLDPYAGRDDLRRRRLRCVGEPEQRFAEDYLRVLRGLRFAGRYGLDIESATWQALEAAVPRLPRLSGERVREELLKVLLAAEASPSLELYRQSRALVVIAPELAGVTDREWTQQLQAIDHLPPSRVVLRLALLFGPAGSRIGALMTRLRFSNAEVQAVTELARGLERPLPEAADPVGARHWLSEATPDRALDTLRLHIARRRAEPENAKDDNDLAERARLVLRIRRRRDPVTVGDLAIDGNDIQAVLGLRPGPEVGRLLERCLEAVMDNPELNVREDLLALLSQSS